MRIEFTQEQVQVLYELIGKSQITGQAAKMIAGLQTVIEKAVEAEKTLPEKEEK
jgi:hypothetical protein